MYTAKFENMPGSISFSNSVKDSMVKNVLYKLHRNILSTASKTLKDIFSASANAHLIATDGSSDDHPIVLPTVTTLAFEALLSLCYGRWSSPSGCLTVDNTNNIHFNPPSDSPNEPDSPIQLEQTHQMKARLEGQDLVQKVVNILSFLMLLVGEILHANQVFIVHDQQTFLATCIVT
ncbi:hypothetical protein SERLADRAFT_405858 [Serpula lacrymans var. lacrymans S7.9]|uniref:Uncharacterized protein n=1 Tax=Serpula lacrymans var. lacrymans (strain S7.9) TaxID=578457 RepID=F8NLN8_SERL9|nr:uncharacterized protein SERLADRAFT_405858 [Serpula lacrymans var. lacrymans S7.9]EGO28219.1 hypothetical protein SERLADRAFT_405858 [Serpula lacrymans var. lacrymans S7.9]